jgi:hypothetical protein
MFTWFTPDGGSESRPKVAYTNADCAPVSSEIQVVMRRASALVARHDFT